MKKKPRKPMKIYKTLKNRNLYGVQKFLGFLGFPQEMEVSND